MQGCSNQTALVRQDLPRTYLARARLELESRLNNVRPCCLQESFIICVVLSLVLSTGAMGAIFAYARYHQLLLIPSAP